MSETLEDKEAFEAARVLDSSDFYEVLRLFFLFFLISSFFLLTQSTGVKNNATVDEIRKAYMKFVPFLSLFLFLSFFQFLSFSHLPPHFFPVSFRLALRLHPDKAKLSDSEAAFKCVLDAKQTLSDPEKRAGLSFFLSLFSFLFFSFSLFLFFSFSLFLFFSFSLFLFFSFSLFLFFSFSLFLLFSFFSLFLLPFFYLTFPLSSPISSLYRI